MQTDSQERVGATVSTSEQRPVDTLGRVIRRISRGVALPAFTAMVGGLLLYYAVQNDAQAGETFLGPRALPLNPLPAPAVLFTGLGAMSAGVLALAALPALTVLFLLIQSVRLREWADMVTAAAVLTVLGLSLILGH